MRKLENDLRSQGAAISREKLAEVLGHLEDAFLVATVGEYSRALSDDPRSMPKVYGMDPGLVFANSRAAAQDVGQRLETAIYLELRRRRAVGRNGVIGSGRTRTHGYGIDFVVGDAVLDGAVQLYQVCAHLDQSDTTRQREIRALREAMTEHAAAEALVLTMDDEGSQLAVPEGVINIQPAWEWCLGLWENLQNGDPT